MVDGYRQETGSTIECTTRQMGTWNQPTNTIYTCPSASCSTARIAWRFSRSRSARRSRMACEKVNDDGHIWETAMTYFVLNTTSLHLVAENLGTVLLCLGFVNVLHENTLVFEYITLRFLVKGVVPVEINSAVRNRRKHKQ